MEGIRRDGEHVLSLTGIFESETEEHLVISCCKSLDASCAAAEKSEWRMVLKIFRERNHFKFCTHTLWKTI